MALADGKATIKANMKARMKTLSENSNKDMTVDEALDYWVDFFVDELSTWITTNAELSVPGTGLVGYNSTPITGTSTTGTLS
jgi:hypothetical protein